MEAVWLFVVIFFEIPHLITGQCWQSEVDKCDRNLARYFPRANLKYYSADTLAGFCRARPSYDSCIENMFPYCPEKRKAELTGLRDAYEYQCDEVYKIVVDSEPCLRGDDAQLEARDCGLAYQMNVNSAESVSTDCSVVNGYLKCLKDAVGARCGENAGYMIRNFTILTLEPLFKDGDCKLGQEGHMTDSATSFLRVYPTIRVILYMFAFSLLVM